MFLAKLSVFKKMIILNKLKKYKLQLIYNIYSTKLYIYAILYIPILNCAYNFSLYKPAFVYFIAIILCPFLY